MRSIRNAGELGAALRERRLRAGLTQAQVAERAEVSRAFVTELERGRRPRAELMRVFMVMRALETGLELVDAPTKTADQALSELLGFA
ncbi:helix-turn-helix transcriptional regulator [Pseudactinotalea terrae]|uniref:helix-turn-helix transcriptional regulator n=1 Tax=Pseudactinotalea terrae TaxID=1743262 RepID=UPI0013912CB2|nr:helix-turn-helix transcriptional regulator [Pseudactinotalea terrae]